MKQDLQMDATPAPGNPADNLKFLKRTSDNLQGQFSKSESGALFYHGYGSSADPGIAAMEYRHFRERFETVIP